MAYLLNLAPYQCKELFQNISNFITFMKVELKVLEYLLSFWHGNAEIKPPYLYVDDTNLHRVFFFNQDGHEIISFGFNFQVKTAKLDLADDSNMILQLNLLRQNGNVNVQNVAEAISILNSLKHPVAGSYSDFNLDPGENISKDSIVLFEYLLFAEPGYIRYDDDIRGYKPELHPRHHFDISFTPNISYKFGLKDSISIEQFIQALSPKKKCAMIEISPKEYPIMRAIKRKKKRK